MFSSEPEARMLVSFFARTTLIATSLSSLARPTTMPSYTSTPGADEEAAALFEA